MGRRQCRRRLFSPAQVTALGHSIYYHPNLQARHTLCADTLFKRPVVPLLCSKYSRKRTHLQSNNHSPPLRSPEPAAKKLCQRPPLPEEVQVATSPAKRSSSRSSRSSRTAAPAAAQQQNGSNGANGDSHESPPTRGGSRGRRGTSEQSTPTEETSPQRVTRRSSARLRKK